MHEARKSILAPANLCRAGILRLTSQNLPGWNLACDSIINVELSDSVLRKAAATFDGLPIVLGHKDDIHIDNVVGINKGTWFDYPFLKAYLHIWDSDAIEGIRDGSRKQCSIGFSSTHSTNPRYAYDARYLKVTGTYIALVPQGACGKTCSVSIPKGIAA